MLHENCMECKLLIVGGVLIITSIILFHRWLKKERLKEMETMPKHEFREERLKDVLDPWYKIW